VAARYAPGRALRCAKGSARSLCYTTTWEYVMPSWRMPV